MGYGILRHFNHMKKYYSFAPRIIFVFFWKMAILSNIGLSAPLAITFLSYPYTLFDSSEFDKTNELCIQKKMPAGQLTRSEIISFIYDQKWGP